MGFQAHKVPVGTISGLIGAEHYLPQACYALYAWGTHGTEPGLFWAVHQFSSDSEGNLYTAEVFGGRPQKFRPRPGADPSHFFKQVPLMPKKSS